MALADIPGSPVARLIAEGRANGIATPQMKLQEAAAAGNIDAIKVLQKLQEQNRFNELVYYKATSQEAKEKGHYGDIPYYKQYYGRHMVRFFQELDRFVGGLHDDCKRV